MEKELKILVLEDIRYDYELIAHELQKLEQKNILKLVTTEDDFKKELKNFDPDIILSDYNLPEYDGMSALLYTLKAAPNTPFIIVTGSINEEIAVDCIKAGACDYVTKEHLARLVYAINRALKQKEILKEKELTQKKLVESEKRYRHLYEESADPILIIENYRFVDCNQSAINFLGFSNKSELINTHPSDLSPNLQPDGRKSKEKEVEMIEIAIKNGYHHFEWVHTTKGGKEIWVDVSLTYIPSIGKDGVYAIWRNITEQKHAELTREVLYNISEFAEKAVNLEDLSKKIHEELGKIIDNNNFYIALYHSERDTYTFPFFKDKYDTITPDFEEKIPNTITDYVRRKGKAIRITKEIEKKLNQSHEIISIGEYSPVWIGAPLIDTANEEVIGVVAIQNYEDENALSDEDVNLLAFVARNIGTSLARKKAEIHILESEEKFRTLFDSAIDSIFILENNKILECNKATLKMFNIEKKEDILGKAPWEISPNIQPDNNNSLEKAQSMINIALKKNSHTFYWKHQRNDGSSFDSEISLNKYEIGSRTYIQSIIKDITKRKQDEEELKLAKEKAEESDRLKTAFLANMSHEIRTPMNAILGFSELLSMADLSKEERDEFITLIQTNSNALLTLINDIIDIAKIEAGQLKIAKKEFSVNKLLDDIHKTYIEIKSNQGKQHIELNLIPPDTDDEIIIFSDQSRINQVICNLVGNAIKYTEEGKIEFGFKIVNENKQDYFTFYIKDTGIGIPLNKQQVIFDRFRQGDDSHTREYGGTGLGLAISKNIAKLLKGDITVESEEDVGSVFYFKIPIKLSTKLKTEQKTKSTISDKLDLSGKTILIAEDVESNFQLLETYLLKTNAKILWAQNGQEAIDFCKNNNDIDLILMDMQMPVLNGYEATKEIKKFRPELPIIAETAFALAGDKEKIIEAGCDDYVSKPIKASLLYEIIKPHIK